MTVPRYRFPDAPIAGTFTLDRFLDDNPDLDHLEECAIRALVPGERVTLGGGAAGVFTIERIDEEESP